LRTTWADSVNLKALVGQTARRFGYEIVRSSPDLRRALLAEATVLLDVGANIGQYASRARRAGYVGRIVSFEPFAPTFDALLATAAHDPAWECVQLALGERDATTPLNICRNSQSSSFLPLERGHLANNPEWDYVGTVEVPMRRLDSVECLRPGDRAFLKVDTEGYELNVLRGAERTLSHVVAVEAELSLGNVHEGQPSIPQILACLDERGFEPVWLERILVDRTTGFLLQIDALFRRRGATSL
jgi:FkbM family methyltransferase